MWISVNLTNKYFKFKLNCFNLWFYNEDKVDVQFIHIVDQLYKNVSFIEFSFYMNINVNREFVSISNNHIFIFLDKNIIINVKYSEEEYRRWIEVKFFDK